MARLHPDLESAQALLPTDLPVALLTRHSVRELVQNGFAGYDVPLTAEGVRLAEHWGGRLTRPVAGFWSSPVGRCLDTARAMARGAELTFEVAQALELVEPGCFVEDVAAVMPVFLAMGPVAFASQHLSRPVSGLRSPAEGTAKVLAHIQRSLGAAGSLTVHVTHDTILAACIYHLAGRDAITEADWPWMMEGAWLWFEADHVHWIWRGQPGRRALVSLDQAERRAG